MTKSDSYNVGVENICITEDRIFHILAENLSGYKTKPLGNFYKVYLLVMYVYIKIFVVYLYLALIGHSLQRFRTQGLRVFY